MDKLVACTIAALLAWGTVTITKALAVEGAKDRSPLRQRIISE